MQEKNNDLTGKIKKIKCLVMDADGVLTDGTITLDNNGHEIKSFNVYDGLGIDMWHKAGFKTAIVSGRQSEALKHRAKELKINLLIDGINDKVGQLDKIENKLSIDKGEIAFVGDDINDLKIMQQAGLSIAVSNARDLIKDNAELIADAPGGNGAIREIIEYLLNKKGLLDSILK